MDPEEYAPPVASPMMSTGVPNLDAVLGGGLPRASLALIVGPPGSGKTTLACQIAFAAAQAGRRTLILTALSEPTSKLISHLRTFRFFDETILGGLLQVMSLEQFLPQGLASVGDELRALVRESGAEMVVIDGFRGIRGTDADPQRAREFLYDLGSALSVRGITIIITSEADPRDPAFFPELTAADVIVGLHFRLAGVRHLRAIEAIKVRGSAPLPGLHGLLLNDEGGIVYPRLEARAIASLRHGAAETAGPVPDKAPAQIGVPGLDVLLDGGLARSTMTLMAGSLGTGKTTLALRFALAGSDASEPALFLGFRELPEQLRLKARVFDAEPELERALGAGALNLLYLPPVELHPDIVAERLLAALDRTKARRLVVDSIAELERAIVRSGDPGRVDDYLAALAAVLRGRGVTSLLIKETPRVRAETLDIMVDPVGMVAENVLLLQHLAVDGRLRRVLSALKTRFTPHDATLHELVIGPPDGLRIVPFAGALGHGEGATAQGLG